jgi:hypothetical protein
MLNMGVMPIPPAIMMMGSLVDETLWLKRPYGPSMSIVSPALRRLILLVQSPSDRMTNCKTSGRDGVDERVKEAPLAGLKRFTDQAIVHVLTHSGSLT